MRNIAVMALLASLLTMAARSKSERTAVWVEVKNQFDKPVDNAAVILDFLGSHDAAKLGFRKKMHWEVRTNQQGIAHFPPIPAGTIQLQVITSKYQTFGEKIDIEGEEKRVPIKLNPPQNQYSAHEPLKPATPPKDQSPKPPPNN